MPCPVLFFSGLSKESVVPLNFANVMRSLDAVYVFVNGWAVPPPVEFVFVCQHEMLDGKRICTRFRAVNAEAYDGRIQLLKHFKEFVAIHGS